MGNEKSSAACRIQRAGKVVRFEDDQVLIEVEGKTIRVPKTKTASDLDPGDLVSWTDGRWRSNGQTKR